MPMTRPNFFIVGAPKCGTTALFKYLKTHPDVYLPHAKEPCFFCDDFPGEQIVKTLDDYLKLFDDVDRNYKAIGEASVWYLYSKVAIENLYAFNSAAKLIVMLRSPVEQVYSMHHQCLLEWYETEKDFVKAWNLQKVRKSGKKIPRHCKAAQFLQYRDIASYGGQIERLLSVFPREQVHFILFDDLRANPRQVYLDVLAFLGVEDDGRQVFSAENSSKRHRFHWLAVGLAHQPLWFEKLKARIRRALNIRKIGIRALIEKRLVVTESRRPLPDDFVYELRDGFREDIAKVSELIGRDLKHWCQ